MEKGYGFITPKKGGDNARFFDKACKNITPGKGMCVSFVLEETEKGLTAKDLREEDPERVARVTAKVHYGKVKVGLFCARCSMYTADPCQQYFDPTERKPTNGYGFIEPLDPPSYGAPKKSVQLAEPQTSLPQSNTSTRYFFHMDEIVTPDEYGGLNPGTPVSFIIVPAKKGIQAAAVTKADPPEEKKEDVPTTEAEDPFANGFAEMKVTEESVTDAATSLLVGNDGWGTVSSW